MTDQVLDPTEAGRLYEIDTTLSKVAGALLGGAVGDAMGWPTEFIRTREQLEKTFKTDYLADFVPWEKPTGGRFNTYIDYINPGDYSDDTQLTLCLARSLRGDGRVDEDHFAKVELPYWRDYARGAGATINAAARSLAKASVPWNANFFGYEGRQGRTKYTEAGANGVAMRIAPIALANMNDPPRCHREVWRNAITTHGHPRAIVGALTHATCLMVVAKGRDMDSSSFIDRLKSEVADIEIDVEDPDLASWVVTWKQHASRDFDEALAETKTEMLHFLDIAFTSRERDVTEVLRGLGCFEPRTKGSGTSTVAAAIALFYSNGGNFEHAIKRAVNALGADTDTIASMLGNLIGAYRGIGTIPERWLTRMQDYLYFARVGEAITRIAHRESAFNDLAIDHCREQYDPNKDIVRLAKERSLSRGQRVVHDLFGLGWVEAVHSQSIRRRGGGTMLLARVQFDTGQSCVFRSYVPLTSKR